MDRRYIDVHLVIDRYLRGQLAEREEAEFEERLVWDQGLVDELDLAECLREGLRESVAQGQLMAGRPGVVGRLMALFAVPQYAAAASFLLAVTLSILLMLPLTLDDEGFGGLATSTDIIPLIAARGGTEQTISVDAGAWTVLLVDVTGAFDAYRVSVRRVGTDEEPVWIQDGLTVTYPGALAVGMPGTSLTVGRYMLTLEGVRVSEAGARSYEHIQDIPFRAVLPD